MDEARTFLRFLFGRCGDYRGSAFLTLTAIHPDKRHRIPSRHLRLGDASGIRQAVRDLLVANARGWGAYVAIGLRKRQLTRYRRGKVVEVAALPALFVDIDDDSPAALARLQQHEPSPGLILASGGGYHGYWRLRAPTTNIPRTRLILRQLARELQADTSMTPDQVMRLAGSRNTKPHRNRAPCKILSINDALCTLDDFDVPSSKQSRSPGDTLNPDLIAAVVRVLERDFGGYAKANGYLAARCPLGHHQHDRAGQHFNFDVRRGCGKCFGRHGVANLSALCACLHIDPARYGGIYSG